MFGKIITRENKSCWYGLSWQRDPPAIILKIHEKFIEFFTGKIKLTLETPIVKRFMDEFNFSSFSGDFAGNFGFNEIFQRRKAEGDFIELIVAVPAVKKEIGKCESCGGSGSDKISGLKCFLCGGSGKKTECDWSAAYAISATFSLLFVALAHTRQLEIKSSPFQLLTLTTATLRDSNGCSLSGKYSIPLVNFLKLFDSDTDIPEIVEAMKEAYGSMFGKSSDYDFRATIASQGQLHISCPGSSCGLNPSFNCSAEEEQGYDFDSHNVDNPAQQITLLAGLAALCGLARKTGY